MSDFTTNLQLPYLMPAQAQKHVTVNEALRRMDALVQMCVQSRTTAAQPDAPVDGQLWILPPGKSGAVWSGFTAGRIAYYRDGAWEEIAPRPGWFAFVADIGELDVYSGSGWVSAAAAGGALLEGDLANTAAVKTINQALATTSQPQFAKVTAARIAFPAAQSASADPNTLDDYEEGAWTPSVTFATPGDLSVSYSVRQGQYLKIGRGVTAWWTIQTSAFTHGGAAGHLRVTGLPFAMGHGAGATATGPIGLNGFTKASYTLVCSEVTDGESYVRFLMSGSGVGMSYLAAGDVPSGGTLFLRGSVQYLTAN